MGLDDTASLACLIRGSSKKDQYTFNNDLQVEHVIGDLLGQQKRSKGKEKSLEVIHLVSEYMRYVESF
jgi:hypothetical protein